MSDSAPADAELSQALVLYTSRGRRNYPHVDSEAVLIAFGPERGAALRDRVEELFSEANGLAQQVRLLSLVDATRTVESVMAQRHPELTPAALSAIGWKWSWDWK